MTLSKNFVEEYQSRGSFLITLISETLDISFEINAQHVYLQKTQQFPLGMLIFGQTSINVFLYSFPEKLTTNSAILSILHPHLTVRIFPRVLILGPRRVKKRKAR